MLVDAWGSGPFDNDDAADFVADLSGMTAEVRAQQLRAALTLSDGYLQIFEASVAVAASDGMPLTGPAEVEELIQSRTVPVDDQVRAQARAALSRVNGGQSEWRELLVEANSLAEAANVLDGIRLHL